MKYRVLAAFAFVVVAAVVGLVLYSNSQADQLRDHAYQSAHALTIIQRKGCRSNNKFRRESNRRIRAHDIDRDVLEKFLTDAARKNDAVGGVPEVRAARDYLAGRSRLRSQVIFHKVALRRCNHEYPLPARP